MRKYFVGVVLVALSVWGMTNLTQTTSAATQVNFTATNHMAPYSTCPGYPLVRKLPCHVVMVGFATSSVGGTEVDVDRTTITGHPSPRVYKYSGTSVLYSGTGTLTGTWSGMYTIRVNGTKVDSARGRFTGGVGTVSGIPTRDIRGTFTFTGSNRRGTRLYTYKTRGTLIFP